MTTDVTHLHNLLFNAARDGDIAVIADCIQKGVPVDAMYDLDVATPLMFAVQHRKPDAVRALIHQHGAKVNLRDSIGRTALIHAIVGRSIDCLKELIASGADINLPNNQQMTPLMLSIQGSNMDAFRMLMSAGADIHRRMICSEYPEGRRKSHWQAIDFAIDDGMDLREMVTALLDAGATLNDGRHDDFAESAFVHTAGQGNLEVIRALWERGTDINEKNSAGVTALMLATMAGQERVVSFLIEHGADASLKSNAGDTVFDINERMPEIYPSVKAILRAHKSRLLLKSIAGQRKTPEAARG